MAASSIQSQTAASKSSIVTVTIPPQLKFLMSNIKNLVPNPLTADNYSIWKSQIEKVFTANGFRGFIDGTCTCPPQSSSSEALSRTDDSISYSDWILIDQNLSAALYSVITPSILPYVLTLDHCQEIWNTLAHRLQATNRSRIIQLKNELHHLSKGNKTMTQYLLEVKSKVDAIAATGHVIDAEDVILYTLNGLPSSYQSFNTAIRTNLQPISLDDLYSLLCSEEQIQINDTARDLQSLNLTDNAAALAVHRGRGRGRNNNTRGNRGRRSGRGDREDRNLHRNTVCQICSKTGHSAVRCWYRNDPAYNDAGHNTALITSSGANSQAEWFLDSGASAHLTAEASQLSAIEPYTGNSQVTVGNGQQLPIHNTGRGILPTPTGNLYLHKLHHVPNLSFNLLSVHQLTTDNNCTISFSSDGYQIKDSKTQRLLLKGPCHNGLYKVQATSLHWLLFPLNLFQIYGILVLGIPILPFYVY
ncbi:hypothetical protein KFK09_018794 [Dendrobium nobile]|uniref:Retrovirus-related Pol polyprotein from transposon TNT 1-94-like beta-barrel domain-containing protein n=1 Tax=Dendrobium nobile TaxID=94219 RepID=A0A8T3AWS7_DENNO|nr:hypothetical protein KFK09_018794 [Dendrobium nobile]